MWAQCNTLCAARRAPGCGWRKLDYVEDLSYGVLLCYEQLGDVINAFDGATVRARLNMDEFRKVLLRDGQLPRELRARFAVNLIAYRIS